MTTTSDARKRRAEATTATPTPDAATVAAVLVEHVKECSSSDCDACECGWSEEGGEFTEDGAAYYYHHVAAALLAAPPIAQALAAVEVVARIEAEYRNHVCEVDRLREQVARAEALGWRPVADGA